MNTKRHAEGWISFVANLKLRHIDQRVLIVTFKQEAGILGCQCHVRCKPRMLCVCKFQDPTPSGVALLISRLPTVSRPT